MFEHSPAVGECGWWPCPGKWLCDPPPQQDMHEEALLAFPQRHTDRHEPHAQLSVTWHVAVTNEQRMRNRVSMRSSAVLVVVMTTVALPVEPP